MVFGLIVLQKEQSTGKKLSQDEEKEVGILGNLFILWCAIRKSPPFRSTSSLKAELILYSI